MYGVPALTPAPELPRGVVVVEEPVRGGHYFTGAQQDDLTGGLDIMRNVSCRGHRHAKIHKPALNNGTRATEFDFPPPPLFFFYHHPPTIRTYLVRYFDRDRETQRGAPLSDIP